MTLALDTYHVGDCRDLLRQMDERSVHCCVTSPPYWGLRDYGTEAQIGLEKTPEQYVAELVGVFREVRRVLRDDGTVWLNIGDTYAAMQEVGRVDGYGKGRTMGKVQSNRRERRQRKETGIPPRNLLGLPWRVALALQADGWWLRSEVIWHKPSVMPEAVNDRPTRDHEHVFMLTKSSRYFYDAESIKEDGITDDAPGGKRHKRTVWRVAIEQDRSVHFAPFPTKLIEPCILAGSPLGGVVLDPFGGSGTTGRVAEDLGRHWILMDLNPEYAKIAKRKTAQIGLLGRMA